MLYPKKKWFTIALKDEAYFNAALSHYSGHLFLTQGEGRSKKGDPLEALWYRAEAVRVLNERLSGVDHVENGVSDGTIGAVACIVNYEVCSFLVLGLKESLLVNNIPGFEWQSGECENTYVGFRADGEVARGFKRW